MTPSLIEPITLIMIEDDAGHATLIQKNLTRSGICNNMVHFDTGEKAIDFFFGVEKASRQHDKILVLLDLNLPTIDGYEILRLLKADPHTLHIPVIVLTTTDNPREIDRCYELGCNIYITKPVEYDAFTEAIRKLGLMLAVVKFPHANV